MPPPAHLGARAALLWPRAVRGEPKVARPTRASAGGAPRWWPFSWVWGFRGPCWGGRYSVTVLCAHTNAPLFWTGWVRTSSAWCIRRGQVETREALHLPNRLEATLSTKWLMAEMAKSSPVCARGVRVHWKGRTARRRPTHRPSQRRPTLGPAPDMSARHRLLKMARGSRKWPFLAKSSPVCHCACGVH